jgi:hypothetical protein
MCGTSLCVLLAQPETYSAEPGTHNICYQFGVLGQILGWGSIPWARMPAAIDVRKIQVRGS